MKMNGVPQHLISKFFNNKTETAVNNKTETAVNSKMETAVYIKAAAVTATADQGQGETVHNSG